MINSFTHIKILEGHNECVNKVIPLTNDTIVSCSIGSIRVWNTNTYKEEIYFKYVEYIN